MPSADLTLLEQISTQLPSAANIFALGGVCSEGDPTRAYTFDPDAAPSVIRASLGDGDAVEALAAHLRYGKRRAVFFPVAPTVAGTISSVTESVAMPNITPSAIAAAGDVLVTGPFHSLAHAIKITKAGAEGVGKFAYCLDDQTIDGEHVGTFSGDITIPVAKKAEIVGTIDLSGIASLSATLDTLTCIITSDTGGPSTCTFSTPTNVTAVLLALNTAWSGEATVSLVGSDKLLIQSVTAGAAGTLTLGAGTANSVLGLTTGATATGSDATYDLPNTGVRLTFASGTYPIDAIATFTTVAPRIAAGALAALFTRVKAKIALGEAIGAVWVVQEDADAIAGRAMLDALSTELTAARALKFFLWGLYQLHRSTSDDDEIVTYCGSFVDPYVVCSAGDARVKGGLLTGSRFHRPASWVGAWKAARDRFSSDLGNHSDRVLNSAFGVTSIGARDERTATTKLATFRTGQTGDGGGFLVLETMPNSGEVYFYRGRTMAANGSVLGDLGSTRVLLASARQIQRDLDLNVNTDPPRRADGSLVDEDAIRNQLDGPVRALLFGDPEFDQPHASALSVSLPTYTLATKTMSVTFEVQRNAQVKAVTATLGIVDVLSVSEEA